MAKSNFPPLTREPIREIDGTPNDGYVLRILKAYRVNCDCKWSSTSYPDLEKNDPLLTLMNEHQEQRAKLLDKAIEKLSK